MKPVTQSWGAAGGSLARNGTPSACSHGTILARSSGRRIQPVESARVKKAIILTLTHGIAIAAGFALGIYLLPILTAPPGPSAAQLESAADVARYTGYFRRDLEGSDPLHWGEGQVFIGHRTVSLTGRLAPGPDYRLYLAPRFVETEAEFEAVKNQAVEVGPVKTFENFMVPVPAAIDISRFNTAVIWCESFSQFISAAEYRAIE